MPAQPAMRYWVGVTDNSWFDFLSHLQPDEVNFWQPSGKAPFVRLESGAPFLFKLKKPEIKEEWFNGKAYYRLHGQRLANVPADVNQHPGREFLVWHNENQFQG